MRRSCDRNQSAPKNRAAAGVRASIVAMKARNGAGAKGRRKMDDT